jgi:isoleucyl-tRNA synthetase
LVAPILSFTAEELWRHIPGDKEKSVFLSDFPEVNNEFVDTDLEKKWEGLVRVRDEVNKALEIKRQEKFIGNALEAKVILYVDDNYFTLLDSYRDCLSELFITSSVEISKSPAPPESYMSTELKGIAVMIEKADGSKCQRCWNWDTNVGMSDEFPDLCNKCCEVIKS